jgi:neopullulanase
MGKLAGKAALQGDHQLACYCRSLANWIFHFVPVAVCLISWLTAVEAQSLVPGDQAKVTAAQIQQQQEQSAAGGAMAARVERSDPPNWWVGLTSSVMLLIRGKGLQGATVRTSYAGVQVDRTESRPGGIYLFMWLNISSHAKAGQVSLEVSTLTGDTISFDFPLLAPLSAPRTFRGLSEDDVIYLVMPDRFADGDVSNDRPPQSSATYDRSNERAYHGGDLRGIQDHLSYLRNLGITTLWITPIYRNDDASPEDYHGYDAVDFFGVNEHFGTLRDFQALVTAAHQLGLKVVLDVVVNHTGPRHPWVKQPPDSDWFHGTADHHLSSAGPLEPLTDEHAPSRLWRPLLEGWFASKLPDLNQENPRVAQYLIQNALWWSEETGLDGYRLDTFPYVSRAFWSGWNRALRALHPKFATIGEVFDADPDVTAFFTGGRKQYDGIDSGVTTIFDYPLYFALRDVILRGAPIGRLVAVLQHDWLYPHPQCLVVFLGNHDVQRFISAPTSSKEKLKLAFSVLLTIRGIPQIYYGDEIGMPGDNDPDNRRDFPGEFPGDRRNAFESSGRAADQEEIFEHVQRLLRLRRNHPALRHGVQWNLWWDDSLYAFARQADRECLLVVLNNADRSRRLSLNISDTPLSGCSLLKPLLAGPTLHADGDRVTLTIPAREVSIYLVN